LVAILLAYPIWNWRKLDSAQGFLDIELQGLRDELASLGMEQEDTIVDLHEDPLQARLLKVKLTAKHLRELHRGRSDTLAFISHDIRAPLGAAMMLLDQFEVNKYSERMKRMLGRAYSMSESFLQASRAEMANVNKFHGMDMVGVVQQAVDDVYEMAVAKQLKLETYYPEESLWVRGDFGLLLRAVSNILLNAVNYSPTGAAITVLLERDNQFLTLKIKDQGPGIPASKVSKIFKRFSRADAEHQSREGSGLGLYFVNVTIKKHHGTVAVQSKLGHGAMFVVTLPLERRRGSNPVENDRRTEVKTLFNDTI
jgi:signal transduction histidine kinase